MASNNQIWQYAISVVKNGVSANEGFRQITRTELGIRRQDWLATVRAAREELERNAQAYDRQGNRRPYRREILAMQTVTATGFMQHIDIWVKDNETGEIYPRPYSIRTDDLLTHDDAIATALDRYSDSAKFYGETILGAAYSTTFELIPGEQ